MSGSSLSINRDIGLAIYATLKQRTSAPVLVEALKSGKVIVPPSVIAARLAVRGLAVTADQVKQIFTEHGIEGEKKRRSANDNAYILKTEGALSE